MGRVLPPVVVQLADPVRAVPVSRADRRLRYEPKWDGWRAVLFTRAGLLRSRRDNDLGSRFTEVLAAGQFLGDLVIDGEIVALRRGRLDFAALSTRPRDRDPAGITVFFVAFDLLGARGVDWRPRPYWRRRAELERRFAQVRPPLQLTPSTNDLEEALTWMQPEVAAVGIEGVIAKPVDAPYRGGRGGWIKIRQMVVVDAVVVGVTGDPRRPREAVLARPNPAGRFEHIGLSLPLSPTLSREIGSRVTVTGEPARPVSGSRVGPRHTEYVPVGVDLVVEIEAEASILTGNSRLRPRVHRARPDQRPSELEVP